MKYFLTLFTLKRFFPFDKRVRCWIWNETKAERERAGQLTNVLSSSVPHDVIAGNLPRHESQPRPAKLQPTAHQQSSVLYNQIVFYYYIVK